MYRVRVQVGERVAIVSAADGETLGAMVETERRRLLTEQAAQLPVGAVQSVGELDEIVATVKTCRKCKHRKQRCGCRGQMCDLLGDDDAGLYYDVIHKNQPHPDSRCPLRSEER